MLINLKFDNLSIEDNNSKKLLITFGGIRQGMGMPVYEFYNSLKDLNSDKVYVKDINQAWYHKGINKEVKNIETLKQVLHEIIKRKSYDNVVFIGNSMGGYAAILFGVLLHVDSVIAFSPQTFINKVNRLWYKDERWTDEISKIYINNNYQKKFYNLKTLIKRNKSLTQIDIFYSTNDKLDRIHSERLKNNKQIDLHPYKIGNHNLIKVLRDEGTLVEIIRNRIEK